MRGGFRFFVGRNHPESGRLLADGKPILFEHFARAERLFGALRAGVSISDLHRSGHALFLVKLL